MTNVKLDKRQNEQDLPRLNRKERMIAGLPWTAWLLLIASVGLGLSIVLVFYFTHRRNGASDSADMTKTD